MKDYDRETNDKPCNLEGTDACDQCSKRPCPMTKYMRFKKPDGPILCVEPSEFKYSTR